jgi:hypothetical protein
MVNGSEPQAAAICRAETYWLERPASMTTLFCEKLPVASMVTGGQPVGASMATPSDFRASTSGLIGRLRICSSPSTT